ncbi:SEC-C domain-containing protein [Actinoplanes sp. KI2]|uniref:SEC-C domain-containing protein n=1 Tax=Actinoplanes sp. KI2 TaxID=2983315 RepID=UPI0021D5C5D0|nr:SEC-C domain-containing protein [Actinoplanes sp. KI2]MCU7726220.1 SEC-C domain-containing protein [Actinoplanes sp. KI2]
MPLKADLTSDDLTSIRESALGTADPLGIAAELADAVDTGRLADMADAGAALTLAAEIAESRSKLDAALRYAARAVEAYGDRVDGEVVNARAVHARILFRAGRADEAMATVEPLRPQLTEYPEAAAYVSAALAAGGRLQLAEEWLTEALRSALAARGEPTEPDGVLFFLLQQRHRVRHALRLPHDQHDDLAEKLETRLANSAAPAAADDLLFFPRDELARALAQWPGLASAYGADWDEHRARLERELTRQAGAGQAGLGLLPGTVAGLTAFAGGDGDPADPRTRAGYASRIASGSGQIPWPPERNGACWCGSGLKYKKCCLPRGRR